MSNKYLPAIPYLTPERSQKFIGIVLTLCALSFFGFFAIKPTISTILKLQKELSDDQFVLDQMEIKIKNLSELRKQYFNLQNDIINITNAIPTQASPHLLLAQIQSVAQSSNIVMKKLQNNEVEIARNDKNISKNFHSYSFTISGFGSFENISKFVSTLTSMERIINIETFSINNVVDQKNGPLGFDLQGIAFFKDNL